MLRRIPASVGQLAGRSFQPATFTSLTPFTACTRAYSKLPRKHQKAQSPLALAFKMNDDDDDEVGRYAKGFDPRDAPLLDHLEKRWAKMDQLEQDEIIMYLQYKERGDWMELTPVEKKAIWYINYGPWGPRGPIRDDPGRLYAVYAKVIALVLLGVGGYQLVKSTSTPADEAADESKN